MTTNSIFLSSEIIIDNVTNCIDNFSDSEQLHNPSYETGLSGFALYYLYLSKYKNDKSSILKAERYLNKAISSLDLKNFKRVYDTDSLDAQLSHIGRFLLFCNKHNLLDTDSNDYLKQLDDVLFDLMKSKITIKDFDSTSGALASGFYFLSRTESGVSQDEKISYLVNSLDNFSKKDKDGDYFWHSPSLYDRVYLGISHGSALIISFLTNVYKCNIEKDLCVKIIDKAVNFLFKQYRKSKYKGLFPNMIGDKIEPMQFALCYGDIGVGYALLKAAKILSSVKIEIFSNMILDDCLLRSKDDNLTLDAGIFYGASGLGIAFDQISLISSDQKFSERADYWYQQIPNYAIYENKFAGFQSRLSKNDILWNVSFGWGILGIGISLMCNENRTLPSLAELTFIK